MAIDIARAGGGVQVTVHVYDAPLRGSQFCTDVGFQVTESVWRAVSGTVTVTVSAPGLQGKDPALYRATVRIDGAIFVNDAGQRVSQSVPIVLTALVSGGIYGLFPLEELESIR